MYLLAIGMSLIGVNLRSLILILEGEENNLSEEFILRMFKAIHQESINHQEEIINH